MKVLIAPDKFKGSLTATEAGNAIRDGLLAADAATTCKVVPLADGGEGTVEVLTTFSGGTLLSVEARDPLHRKITADYGLSHDRTTAFIEMAAASGLHRLASHERHPLLTSTAGTGDLIRDALDRGVRKICTGIGGSATNDGGTGALVSLGMRFYDKEGNLLDGSGGALCKIQTIDHTHLHPRLHDAAFTIFCDVDNPLHGPRGAAYVFGPQKGATSDEVRELDQGLRHYESVLHRNGYAHTDFPGAGAGGGFPVSLAAFSHVVVQPGIEFILQFVGLEHLVRSADLVITGEGQLDDQTLSGKVVKGVASLAHRYHKPVVAVVGSATVGEEDLRRLHIDRVISLVDEATSTQVAMQKAADLIRERVRTWRQSSPAWG